MASACVNNVSVSAYGCFNPRAASEMKKLSPPEEEFEFRSGDTVGMLPADELFSNGKLVTKQHSTVTAVVEVETEISGDDSLVVSPKAPRCSSKWRELLGLKRFSQNSKASSATASSATASFKQFLHRSSKTSSFSSEGSLISLPLLSDSESMSVSSSRTSLSSSSSSSHDHEDTPRLSLDAERLNHLASQNITANPFAPARPRMRLVKPRDREETSQSVSVDSPRLNSSGKIVYQSLERSSSSPSGTSGGYRNRGVERSYSVNVRVAPVLNVPVCSVRGGSVIFSQFFSSSASS
ncbi:hypothetical protein N665_0331s0035, partial [Sinapis alba]